VSIFLTCAYYETENSKIQLPKIGSNIILVCIVCIGLIFSVYEVKNSFNVFPFSNAIKCHVNTPLSPDRWTSGSFEYTIPIGSKELNLEFSASRPNIETNPISVKFGTYKSSGEVLKIIQLHINSNDSQKVKLSSVEDFDSSQNSILKIETSSCYLPLNLGVSNDSRRLGIHIDKIVILN
jgi:hypothetical protein